MRMRLASLWIGLALVTLSTSGCFTPQGDGVFGPANSLGGDENNRPALSLKASPARGPGPLDVEFSLSARDRDGDALSWDLAFGDGSAHAAGTELPAKPRHTYKAPGAYVATLLVKDPSGESLSTLSIVVLEGVASASGSPSPTQGPEPEPEEQPSYQSPRPTTQSTSSSTSTTNSTSNTTTSESSTTTSEPTSSTSTSTEPTSSTSTSTSETSTSTSETGTSTFSSTSDSGTPTPTPTDPPASPPDPPGPTPTEDPAPPESESSTSSDPPL